MRRDLASAVAVVTGASSGIGRATAEAFAAQGTAVVLAARRAEVLQDHAEKLRVAGHRAVAVPTDVRDPAAVGALARAAVEAFGHLDVWVNNAGVGLYGPFDETPPEVYRELLETNLFGYVNGIRAALGPFREQGFGVIVNNASLNGKVGAPYASAYVASKFAVVGLSESLRQEFRLTHPGIHVSTVLPASIDTPFFQHAANYVGRALKPLDPVYAPQKVARAIVACARRPRREVMVGGAGRLLYLQRLLAPALFEPLMARLVDRNHFQSRPADSTPGSVLEALAGWVEASGHWRVPEVGTVGLTKPLVQRER